MSMLKCTECGEIFDEEETLCVREDRGEFWGAPAYEDFIVCPHCAESSLEEVYQCTDCDDFFTSENLIDGRCPSCRGEGDS